MRTPLPDATAATAARDALPDRSDMWDEAIGLPAPSNLVTHSGAAVTSGGADVTHTP